MNYYIQGDAANAEQIKAAFEKLGYDTTGHLFNAKSVLYFTLDGGIRATTCNCTPAIIKTHPDYQELELPVEPKFKVGDWVVRKDGETFYGGNYAEQITLIEIDEKGKCIWFSSKTWAREDAIRPWTIADAKDGDVLMTTKVRNCPFIYRKNVYNNNLAYYYVGIDGNGDFCEGYIKRTLSHFGPVADVIPATKEQRDMLFAKMKEAGYEWDADKKELRKIKPHYDIKNFKPFDKVMVRDRHNDKWECAWFSHYDKTLPYPFITTGADFKQCIPLNDDTKHLLGTTEPCGEEYINW